MLPLLAARSSRGDPVAVVLVIAAIVAVLVVVWYFSKAQRLKRKLRSAPIRSISQLSEDEVGRVVGTARAYGKTLSAPLTDRTCVYYSVEVETRRGKGWRTLLTEARAVEFLLEDGSGRALVDPTRADLAVDFDRQAASGAFKDADPSQDALLARHGEASEGLIFNRALRYREAIIEVGERVAVLGCCRRVDDSRSRADADASGGPPVPLRLVNRRDCRLVISDAPSTTEA